MRAFDAPLNRHGWCQQWCARVRNSLASRKLGWRTPEEKLTGDTPDISVFRFHFWQEIEYYNSSAKNPSDGWCDGRFLGINDSAGDDIAYFIEVKSPSGRPTVITRSNVRAKIFKFIVRCTHTVVKCRATKLLHLRIVQYCSTTTLPSGSLQHLNSKLFPFGVRFKGSMA